MIKFINRAPSVTIRSFIKAIGAAAAIEFALAVPVLLLLAMGGFEMTRYIIIQQKISKTVGTMADLVARSPSIAESDITNMYAAVPHLMSPYTLGANGIVLLSDVGNNGTVTKVNWQRSGGGTYSGTSHLGAAGANATLPSGFTLATNEDTVVAEIFYNYQPLIAPKIVGQQVIYKAKYAKPRLGSLTTVNP